MHGHAKRADLLDRRTPRGIIEDNQRLESAAVEILKSAEQPGNRSTICSAGFNERNGAGPRGSRRNRPQ